MTSDDSFGEKLAAYQELQNMPWGKLRYMLAAANLKRHIAGTALSILDAGCGNGFEAIPFALQGHSIALLDWSAEMLAEAHRRAENSNIVESITFHRGDIASIPTMFPGPQFDVVLCHNVVEYLDDLNTSLEAIGYPLKHNGFVSLIAVNRYSEPYFQALQELDLQAAYASLDSAFLRSKTFAAPRRGYTTDELRRSIEGIGCSVVGQYGIRCVNDYISNNELKNDPVFFAELGRLEYLLSDRYPYYLLARFIHIIAQRVVS
jgi:S-adenosylmethionine-dependent methyltransferase